MAAQKLNLRNSLDNTLFNHISYVVNRSLLILKKEGVGAEQREKILKYFLRLFQVVQAYNSKKRKLTLSEIISIVDEFKSIFGG